MVTMLDDSLLETIDNLRKFVDGSLPITFRPLQREERSQWIRHTLVRFKYLTLKRADKQVVRQYLMKISDLSRAQAARHITAYKYNRPICRPYVRRRFPVTYTQSDLTLLAETDNLHQAQAKTPNQAAKDMQKAKKKLFDIVLPRYDDML